MQLSLNLKNLKIVAFIILWLGLMNISRYLITTCSSRSSEPQESITVSDSLNVEGQAFDVVEVMPSFPGGTDELMKYLSSHIQYPTIAEEKGIQGRVICTFVVERDGSISGLEVVKSVDPLLDNEAVRVLRSMPKWVPGKKEGNPVRVKYTIPITFRL